MPKFSTAASIRVSLLVSVVGTFLVSSSSNGAAVAQPQQPQRGECTNVIQNGGFEDGYDHWISFGGPGCDTGFNDGAGPTPLFADVPPLEGNLEFYMQQSTFRPTCDLKQESIPLPANIGSAVLTWKDRLYGRVPWMDPTYEAFVGFQFDDDETVHQVWSTEAGDPIVQEGPNIRSADVTALVQGKTSINLIVQFNVEPIDFNSYITWYMDAFVLTVCPEQPPQQLQCTNMLVNGGFEDGLDHWTESMVNSDSCLIQTNGPDATIDRFDPLQGNLDVYIESSSTGVCGLAQESLTLPENIESAVLTWKDRIFGYHPFSDILYKVSVGIQTGGMYGEVQQVWSPGPFDPFYQEGPNLRSADVTALVQGQTKINLKLDYLSLILTDRGSLDWVVDDFVLTVCSPLENMNGGGIMDPHFKTFHGQWYDFHGICDMVLVHSEEFGNGLGLDIHLRTTPRYQYSYIEAAAIRIGRDVLEVGSWGEYRFNGVEGAELSVLGDSSYPITYTMENKKRHNFVIETGHGEESIVVRTFKDMVSVTVENATIANFGSSVGLMGNFRNGGLVARDGTTIMDDHNLFGQEWQVLESEPQLFQAPNNKPFGTCTPPPPPTADHDATTSRRLGEATVAMEAAEEACAEYEYDRVKKDMCIFDVMAMEDLEVAEAHGAF